MSQCPPYAGYLRAVDSAIVTYRKNLPSNQASQIQDCLDKSCWQAEVDFRQTDEGDEIVFSAFVNHEIAERDPIQVGDRTILPIWQPLPYSYLCLIYLLKYELPQYIELGGIPACPDCFGFSTIPVGFGEFETKAFWSRLQIDTYHAWDKRNDQIDPPSQTDDPPIPGFWFRNHRIIFEPNEPDRLVQGTWDHLGVRLHGEQPPSSYYYICDTLDSWWRNFDYPTVWIAVLITLSARDGYIALNPNAFENPNNPNGFRFIYASLSSRRNEIVGETYPGLVYYNDRRMCIIDV